MGDEGAGGTGFCPDGLVRESEGGPCVEAGEADDDCPADKPSCCPSGLGHVEICCGESSCTHPSCL